MGNGRRGRGGDRRRGDALVNERSRRSCRPRALAAHPASHPSRSSISTTRRVTRNSTGCAPASPKWWSPTCRNPGPRGRRHRSAVRHSRGAEAPGRPCAVTGGDQRRGGAHRRRSGSRRQLHQVRRGDSHQRASAGREDRPHRDVRTRRGHHDLGVVRDDRRIVAAHPVEVRRPEGWRDAADAARRRHKAGVSIAGSATSPRRRSRRTGFMRKPSTCTTGRGRSRPPRCSRRRSPSTRDSRWPLPSWRCRRTTWATSTAATSMRPRR